MKILGVDDDLMARSMLFEALKISGYDDVQMASSGTDALRKIQESATPFECFLLDIQMDDLDGIQLCELIRNMPAYSETPIIMVTGLSEKHYMESAFDAGATDYVTKPFDMLELGTRIKIADNISKKIKRISSNEAEIQSLKKRPNETDFTQDMPMGRFQVGGFLKPELFEDRLRQLSQSDLAESALVKCQIAQFEQISTRCTGKDLDALLADVSTAIGNVFEDQNFLATYGGHGMFVLIFRRSAPSEQEFFRVQEALNQIRLSADSGCSDFIMLRFSEPVFCSQLPGQEIPGSMHDGQVDDASGNRSLNFTHGMFGEAEDRETPQQKLERRLKRMIPNYLSVLNESMARLDRLQEKLKSSLGDWSDIDEIERTAHKIAGVAPSLGFSDLGAAASETEKLAAQAPASKNLQLSCLSLESSLGVLLDKIEDTIVDNFEYTDSGELKDSRAPTA